MEASLNPELPTFQSVLLTIIELKESIIEQNKSFTKTEQAIDRLTKQITRTEQG